MSRLIPVKTLLSTVPLLITGVFVGSLLGQTMSVDGVSRKAIPFGRPVVNLSMVRTPPVSRPWAVLLIANSPANTYWLPFSRTLFLLVPWNSILLVVCRAPIVVLWRENRLRT